jgi:fucose permease
MDFVHHAVSIFEIVGQANRVRAHIRMSLFLVMFLAGWNDASQGPLLPSLQEYYNVNYTISTLPHHAIQ